MFTSKYIWGIVSSEYLCELFHPLPYSQESQFLFLKETESSTPDLMT